MRRLVTSILMFCLFILLSCTEHLSGTNDTGSGTNNTEIDGLIDLSTDLELSIDLNGIPYYNGYSVSTEKFNEFVVGAGWSSGVYMYEVVERESSYCLADLEIWEPPFFYDFYMNSSVNLTEYINYYPDSLPYDVLLYKNGDFIYSEDGTIRLSDGSFFMRVVYVSSDAFQAFKLLYTDRNEVNHYALCTFTKMTTEELSRFQSNYTVDYYEYVESY